MTRVVNGDHQSAMSGAEESTLTTPRRHEEESVAAVLDQQSISMREKSLHHRRKRVRGEFPWIHTRNWATGDSTSVIDKRQCQHCKKWFSSSTNAQGWKAHLQAQHGIMSPTAASHNDDSTTSSSLPGTKQQTLIKKVMLPAHVVCLYENAVVDYVVSGDISLRAAGEERFQSFVSTLTNGYTPPSTRTILRRTVELFSIAQPLLAKYLCQLDVCVSLTMDGWSNRNLKGFYVVTEQCECNMQHLNEMLYPVSFMCGFLRGFPLYQLLSALIWPCYVVQ